jgi:hypothetical protein
VLLGWVVDRRELVWPVWGSVVVAVDMGFLWVNLAETKDWRGACRAVDARSREGIEFGRYRRFFRSACHATVGFLFRVRIGSR